MSGQHWRLEDVRGQIDAVVSRAKSDPDYKRQFKSDPEGTLIAAGLPPAAAADLAVEVTSGPEVAGYMRCDMLTCIITCCSYHTGGEGWSSAE